MNKISYILFIICLPFCVLNAKSVTIASNQIVVSHFSVHKEDSISKKRTRILPKEKTSFEWNSLVFMPLTALLLNVLVLAYLLSAVSIIAPILILLFSILLFLLTFFEIWQFLKTKKKHKIFGIVMSILSFALGLYVYFKY